VIRDIRRSENCICIAKKEQRTRILHGNHHVNDVERHAAIFRMCYHYACFSFTYIISFWV